MNRDSIKAFIAWLETAGEAEIEARRQQCLTVLRQERVSTAEGRADVELALRLIDEECLARLELGQSARP
jgi:hypothetical protein